MGARQPLDLDAKAWTRVSALLDAALELPSHDRQGWLADLRPEDREYRPLLEDLLRSGPSATSDFLHGAPTLAQMATDAGSLAPGETVGPYRLLRPLGAGGMGAVWLAERADGQLRREVALKLPIASWAPDLARRMARERDLQAALEHPHIARLYDAGVDTHGRPYLAMQYVDGIPIDRYVAQQGLPVRERVRLFLQVAGAVSHAHSHLIVHRDLKPANVLVTRDGQAQLLDFGIAKLLLADSAIDTAATEFAGRALTPDYAAPEQIRGEVVTVATDVYSLGVLLYEMLTGERAYGSERSSRAALEAAVLGSDPAPPSVRAPTELRPLLRGDLDAIISKALKKSTQERYTSVAALIEDLERHLDGRAVQARPDSWTYRSRKFMRRNALPVSAATAAFAALAIGLAVAAWQAREASQQRDVARAQQQRAEAALMQTQQANEREMSQAALARSAADDARAREAEARTQRARAEDESQRAESAAERARAEAARARATQDFLVDIFRSNSADQDDPEAARRTTARELLDRGAERIETSLVDQPDARREITRTLAGMYSDLGLQERSAQLARTALSLTESQYGRHSLETAAAALDLATALDQGAREGDERLRLLERARTITERYPGAVPQHLLWRVELAAVGALENRDRPAARRHAARAMELAAALSDPVPLQQSYFTAGTLAWRENDDVAAEKYLTRALDLGQSLPAFGASDRVRARVNLALAQGNLFKLESAERNLRSALVDSEKSNGPEHLDTRQTMLRLGIFLHAAADRPRDAAEWLTRVSEASVRADRPDPFTATTSLLELGRALITAGELALAELKLRHALGIREEFRPGTTVSADIRETLAISLLQQGRLADAAAELDQSEALRKKLGDGPGTRGWERTTEVRLLLALTRDDRPESVRLVSLLKQGRLDSRETHRWWIHGALRRARVALEEGDAASARPYLAAVDAMLEQIGIRQQLPILEGQRLVLCGRLAAQTGRIAEARQNYERALALILSRASRDNLAARNAVRWLNELPTAAPGTPTLTARKSIDGGCD